MPEPTRVALVTGAGRGLGRETAVALASVGVRVGLLGRTRATLEDTLRDCARAGARAVAVPTDVTRDDAVRAAVATVERDLGPVDLLVNNAGVVDPVETTPWQADPGDWWRVVETNVRGPFLVSRAVLPGMIARGSGRVVNVNSGMGTSAVPGYSAYSVSKAALARLTDALARDLAGTGVVVLDVSPGLVRTEMTEGMAMWQGLDPARWNDPAGMVGVVLRTAAGELDALHGRFLHAAKDDLDVLLARADEIAAGDARTLRLRPYGDDDPVA